VDVLRERLLLCVYPQDLLTPLLVWGRDGEYLVEPAGSEEGVVDQVDPVRGAEHYDAVQLLEAIHLSQELTHDALRDLILTPTGVSPWRDCVDLVEEDDAGRRRPRLPEDLPHA